MAKSLMIIALLTFATPAFAQPAPGVPLDLNATLQSGGSVILSWSPPATGAPSAYRIEASFSAGGPVIASHDLAATSVLVPNVPVGVYFVRVRSLLSTGPSDPSNEITVEIRGCPGVSEAPENLRVFASGLDVGATWDPPSNGCAPSNYYVVAGSAPGLADIAIINMGTQRSIAAVAPAGDYFIRVVGVNSFGIGSFTNELTAKFAPNAFTDTLPAGSALFFEITFDATGTYNGVLTWNDPANDLDLFLTTSSCEPPFTGCLLDSSEESTGNSEQVSLPVNAGDIYRLWVDNFSASSTSFTIENSVSGSVTIGAATVAPDAPKRTKVKP